MLQNRGRSRAVRSSSQRRFPSAAIWLDAPGCLTLLENRKAGEVLTVIVGSPRWVFRPQFFSSIRFTRLTDTVESEEGVVALATSVTKTRDWPVWNSPWATRLFRWWECALLAVVMLLLVWQISRLGWASVIRSLPRQPWFYVLFLLAHFQFPLAKTVCFRLYWNFPFSVGFRRIYQSTVYNRELGASAGDLFLGGWLVRDLKRPVGEVIHYIKDYTIITWCCSVLWALVVFSVALSTSGKAFGPPAGVPVSRAYAAAAVLLAAVSLAIAVLLHFRKSVFRLSTRQMKWTAMLYGLRLVVVGGLAICQWSLVLPGVGLSQWLSLLAVRVAIQTLPTIPSHQVWLCVASIGVGGWLQIPAPQLAAMFLVNATLEKGVSLLVLSTGRLPVAKTAEV